MFCSTFRFLRTAAARAFILSVALLGCAAANAADPKTLAEEAEALARQGNMPAALERMQEAADALWDLQELKLLTVGFQEGEASAKTVSIKSGDELIVAAQLSGFGYEGNEDNLRVVLAVDIEIRHESGRVLASQENFATISEAVPGRIAEFSLEMVVKTPPLLDGTYELAFDVHDLASKQTQPFTLSFTVDGVLDQN